MSGRLITLHHCLVGQDCKKRMTKPDTQAKLNRKPSAKVGADFKNNTARSGFWGWVMS